MMKWGRKKPPPSSPSRASSTSHVFPMSWLSKFKQKGSNSDQKNGKANQKAEKPALSQSPPRPASGKGGDWVDGEKSGAGGLKSVWYDSDDELEFPLSSCRNCREDVWKFNDMVSDIRKSREVPHNSPDIDQLQVPSRKAAKDQKSRKTSRRVMEKQQPNKAGDMPTVPEEKDIFALEPIMPSQAKQDHGKVTASNLRKHCYVSSANSRNSNLKTIEEDCGFEALNLEETCGLSEEKLSSEWRKLKDMKIKEVMSKGDKQRNSVDTIRDPQRRTKQSGKVRVYSPRTAARIECKIKAIEDMKRARMKRNKEKRAKGVEDSAAFDSFAVVKSSFDPHRDFRNSMIEMITEKGIRGPEELEELLACYLTLNADEYHELIIKVFRQVRFELNRQCFGTRMQNQHSSVTTSNYFQSR